MGYKERTCKGPEWMSVLDNCVNEELNKVVNAAAVSMAFHILHSHNSYTVKLIWNIGNVLVNAYIFCKSACIPAI